MRDPHYALDIFQAKNGELLGVYPIHNDVGQNPSPGTHLPHGFIGHMKRQLQTIAGSDCRTRLQKTDTWNGSLRINVLCVLGVISMY